MAAMTSTVPLPSDSEPAFHNNLSTWHFTKLSTTQKPILSQEEDDQSSVLSHDHRVAMEGTEKKETTTPDCYKPTIIIKLRVKNDSKADDLDHTLVQNQTLVASDGGDSSMQLRLSSTSRQDQDHASATPPVQGQDQPSHELGLGFTAEKLETRKRRISMALSREEIEADILAITGSKRTRRPKRKSKNVQRQFDNLFPGLCLKSITLKTYKV